MDVGGAVEAYEHGLVFTRADIDHLIATAKKTNRMWSALFPYDADILKSVEAGSDPTAWGANPYWIYRLHEKSAGK